MKLIRFLLVTMFIACISVANYGQCKHTLSINSSNAICNGNGTSTVTIDVTVLFGTGNNSATISYNIGSGNVVAVVLEDDDGDLIDQIYNFVVPSCDNYPVILTAWTNPSGSGSTCTNPPPVISNIVLPVTFGHFNVKQVDANVLVTWSTYIEINNEKFAIQRLDEDGNFQTIGEVKGAINSSQEIAYEFVDKSVSRGSYYYRVQQIDLDGNYSFSKVDQINVNTDSRMLIYPNPAMEYISLSTFSSNTFRIFDTFGNAIEMMQEIIPNTKIDISRLESGLYFLVGSDGKEMMPFVKL